MTSPAAGLPLPPAVLARLRTAESLRAEVAGLTAERDALRDELQTAAWERDTAQNEAAYLRDEVVAGRDGRTWAPTADSRVGLLLTMGDEPPPPPEDGTADIAIVSISTGDIYVRAYPGAACEWSRYGTYTSSSDFVTLAESGPWVTVDGWRYRDHKDRGQAARRLYAAVHNGVPGTGHYVHGWPQSTEAFRKTIDELAEKRFADESHPDTAAAWIEAWRNLASSTRAAWEVADKHAERLTSLLRTLPHDAEMSRASANDGRLSCIHCGATEAEHVVAPQAAVSS